MRSAGEVCGDDILDRGWRCVVDADVVVEVDDDDEVDADLSACCCADVCRL